MVLAERDFEFEVALKLARGESTDQRGALFDKYANAVDRVQQTFQRGGDLANALKARDEASKAREQRELGNVPVPELEKLRKVMSIELGKIHLSELEATSKLRQNYIDALDVRVANLTKGGKLDAALELEREKKEEQARLADERKLIAGYSESNEPEAKLGRRTTKKPELVKSSIFGEDEAVTGKVELQPGIHRLRKRAVIGVREFDEKTQKQISVEGHVVSKAGTEIVGGEVYIHNGSFRANDTKFEKTGLIIELQGHWLLDSCLIDDCRYVHNGIWFLGPYSARWEIKNCVFSGEFFKNWESMGLKMESCTFDKAKFVGFDFKKDASEEAFSDGRVLKGCHFVDCKVPATIALATENCLFERCTFTNDWGSEFTTSKPIEKILYYMGSEKPEAPKDHEGVNFVFKPVSEAAGLRFGSTVQYSFQRGKLEFE